MKLGIGERLELLERLPREGTYAALKSIRVARECLSLTPEEMKEFEYNEIHNPTGRGVVSITWNISKEREVDIPLDEYITNIIRDMLVKLDKENKLTERTMNLYERFVIRD